MLVPIHKVLVDKIDCNPSYNSLIKALSSSHKTSGSQRRKASTCILRNTDKPTYT